MSTTHRILVIAHGHPDFSLGGAEIAAYNLFKAYRDSPGVEEAWFLARVDRGRSPGGAFSVRRPGEYLWEQGIGDWHKLKAAHAESLTSGFAELLRALRPTIVHTHHYAHIGVEHLRVIRRVLPDARILLTLHEFLAICSNNGQMIRTDGRDLCATESPDDCRRCFPERSIEDFWLRKHYIRNHFRLVDQFIAPSAFLRQRYIDWGLEPERIAVIENGQHDLPAVPPRPLADGETRNRFGYFGQINPYKGLDVLLEGLSLLEPAQRRALSLEVHGANLEQQSPEFRERIQRLLTPLIDEGTVRWAGAYRPASLPDRMRRVDWVLVPSVWWENSPMVIQEAFLCERPVIASDIGGMAEKVRDGIDGLHVATADAGQWARTLSEAGSDPALWARLRSGIRRPPTHEACARAHLALTAQPDPSNETRRDDPRDTGHRSA